MWGNHCGASLNAPAARRRGFQGSAGVLGVLILYCTSIDKDFFFCSLQSLCAKRLSENLKIQNLERKKKKKGNLCFRSLYRKTENCFLLPPARRELLGTELEKKEQAARPGSSSPLLL